MWRNWFRQEPPVDERPAAIPLGRVEATQARCVQCGICSYNCPAGIDVRAHAWQGLPVTDPTCITCGNCIAVCPRGVLYWGKQEEG